MSKMEEYGNLLLPEDIIVQILVKVPVKYLIRCRCVSKRWCGLILSPQFSKIHFKLASEKKTLTPTVVVDTRWNYRSVEISGTRLLPVKNLTFPIEKRAQFMGSCNGLVILGQQINQEILDQDWSLRGPGLVKFRVYKHLSIWNPCTGFFRSLPDPLPSRLGYCDYTKLGFGYVSSTDDYKIVLIRTQKGNWTGSCCNWKQEVVIFSVRDNLWRSIEARPYQPVELEQAAVLSNETLHWLPICTPSVEKKNSNNPIVAFDLAKEEFRKVSLPVQNKKRLAGGFGLLVLSSEQLCFWHQERRGYIEFWIMREYNVPESWSFLYKFDIKGFYGRLVPVFVAENGTVVIEECRKLKVVTIDCNDQGRRRVIRDELRIELPGHHFGIFQFDQTLLSIDRAWTHGGDSTDRQRQCSYS